MKCFICDKKTESIFFMHDDNLHSGFRTATINNQSYILCNKCYKDWTKILEYLLNYFCKLGEITKRALFKAYWEIRKKKNKY